MTAEIAVFNKSAVSLAADSAVTISGEFGVNKIYNGADKLFALSKHHPVGIMVYGSADLCGIPWEMIIKQFRKMLGNQAYDTIEEYAVKFWDFLCISKNIIPMDVRENYLIDTYSNRFFPALINHIEKKRIDEIIDETGERPSIEETYDIIEEEAHIILNGLKDQHFFDSFDDGHIIEILEFTQSLSRDICEEKLHKEEGIDIPDSLCEVIGELFAYITCKKSPFGRNTGLVFAGYGEQEFMPAVLAYDVLGYYKDKLRYSPNLHKSSSGGLCGVTAYAQEEEVETFLHGISHQLKSFMKAGIEFEKDKIMNIAEEKLSSLNLSKEDNNSVLEAFQGAITERFDRYQDVIDTHIRDTYTSKVTEMIEFLPKQDLAYMAESLVNLTAFKRKVSYDNETVGGPIDVAIISKGDGFIWVKRKHYFDQNLNHHYFTKQS
ncbi:MULTISPECIES: hypothetical protein [Enterobacteriaceae]|uniref:hypothetical protein n=1 Tax=Enterobacteriaceae TaxID=543 RepID=UPI000272B2DA|nr:hypothetical protein [Enterobacter sp. Ag1]EJF31731.1 hypothetical protein A936_09063 [Enterobacter sp. Ag1]